MPLAYSFNQVELKGFFRLGHAAPVDTEITRRAISINTADHLSPPLFGSLLTVIKSTSGTNPD